jgi:hypothetical protein
LCASSIPVPTTILRGNWAYRLTPARKQTQNRSLVTPARKRSGTKSQGPAKRVRLNDWSTWDAETPQNTENHEPSAPLGLHLEIQTPVSMQLFFDTRD